MKITYSDFKKAATLSEGDKFYEITYGVGGECRKSVYKVNDKIQHTKYYTGNYEEEMDFIRNIKKIITLEAKLC